MSSISGQVTGQAPERQVRAALEDLGSADGTRVNGELIVGPQRLEHGDVIAIGPFAIEAQIAQSSEGNASRD